MFCGLGNLETTIEPRILQRIHLLCTVFSQMLHEETDSRQRSRLQRPQTQCSTVETQDLPVCTTEVYFQCELQPFTEAFSSRSQ